MNWEIITIIYRFVEYSVTTLAILIGVLSIFLLPKLPNNYKFLCINFIIAAIVDLIMADYYYFHFFNFPKLNSLEHLLITSEVILVGVFFYKILINSEKKYYILILISLVLLFELFAIIKYSINEQSEYASSVLSFCMCLAGLTTLFEISRKNLNKNFMKQPDTLITVSFVTIYSVLIIFFLLYPSIVQYPIPATFFIIFKNIFLLIALFIIAKAMHSKAKKPLIN
jgi:hypothetical protein